MIQKIKLARGQTLTKDNIRSAWHRARSSYDYCRIDMKYGMYIIVAFFKDQTFDVMTNNRSLSLWTDIKLVRNTRGITVLTNMIFRWIREFNR